jgi:hypothetical protein
VNNIIFGVINNNIRLLLPLLATSEHVYFGAMKRRSVIFQRVVGDTTSHFNG